MVSRGRAGGAGGACPRRDGRATAPPRGRAVGPARSAPPAVSYHLVAMSLRPLGRALRRIAGVFPVTLRGLATAVLCAGSLRVCGYGSLDLVVFALAVTGLALLAIALAVVSGAALFLRGGRRSEPASWPVRCEAD